MLARVDVLSYDINVLIARVPVRILTVPHPYKVGAIILICELIVEVVPEFLVCVRSLCSPPEPAARSLMQRSPQHGYARVAQTVQLLCYFCNIGIYECLALRVAPVHNSGNIKVGVGGVEAAPPARSALLGVA